MAILNWQVIARVLGAFTSLLTVSMLLPVLWSLVDPGWASPRAREVILAFSGAIGIGVVFSLGLVLWGRGSKEEPSRREALFLVSAIWVIGAILAALPLWFWGHLHSFGPGEDVSFVSFVNAYFEAMSGLTTTGGTVLVDVDGSPPGIHIWRTLTHWIGGLGIVVIFAALLPGSGSGSKRLFFLEDTGVPDERLSPSMRDASRKLLGVYLVLTASMILVMKAVDPELSWLEIVVHTFTTVSTGGFSNHGASAGVFSYRIQWVIGIFMVLAGVNFALYLAVAKGRVKALWRSSELRFYLLVMGTATVVVALLIQDTPYSLTNGGPASSDPWVRFTDAFFQVVSLQTGTGLGTADSNQWSPLVKGILVVLMFIGGCAGSTAGAMKAGRVLGAIKIYFALIGRTFRPRLVKPVYLEQKPLGEEQRTAIVAMIFCFLLLTALGSFALLWTEGPAIDAETAFSAAIACITNVGPGFGAVGAMGNFHDVSDLGKGILTTLMLVGRLEILAVVCLFLPRFWRGA